MTTDKCFSCERKDVSPLCGICGVGLNGEREHYKRKPITNADRIRKWSDEEIAEFTIGVADGVFELFTGTKMPDEKRREMETKWLDWLKEEAKGEEG